MHRYGAALNWTMVVKLGGQTWTPTHSGQPDLDANPQWAARPGRQLHSGGQTLTSTARLTTTDVDVNILLRVVERRPVRTSHEVMSRQSNRPQHHEALYFPHCRLWITEYSCKVWYKPCRRRLIPRQHSRHSWRPRLRHQLRTMVDLLSWSDSRG
ncbi:hypothetical protein Taro_037624 [Colocasia esculenta]|uniref:Uncharacterized protein n=1 Tax=Colocasia esculenta TaxID=4460 RepID=A0A843WGT5_COLES|nr:hypothetical protein [Colocasia esculenta]